MTKEQLWAIAETKDVEYSKLSAKLASDLFDAGFGQTMDTRLMREDCIYLSRSAAGVNYYVELTRDKYPDLFALYDEVKWLRDESGITADLRRRLDELNATVQRK